MFETALMGILAHELGHLEKGDAIFLLQRSAFQFLPRTLLHVSNVLTSICGRVALGALEGGPIGLFVAIFPFVGWVCGVSLYIVSQPLLWLDNTAVSMLALSASRMCEYEADAFAASLGAGEGLKHALEKIYSDTYLDSPWAYRYRSTHPPLAFRLDRLDDFSAGPAVAA